jgi:ParB family chromosome partitioning protein
MVAGAHFAEVPIAEITPNARQPRQTFDEEALEELAASIRIVGLLQPVVVRELGPNRFELIMGERRLRASKLAGLEKIPAIVRDTGDDEMLRDALMENLHRQQLNALEEAAAYQQLLDDFGATHEELATRIGRSRPHITNTLRLLNLPPAVQRRVAAGILSAGHARALLGLGSAEQQEYLAKRIVEEGLSVRAVEELIALGEGGETKKAARRSAPNRPENPRIKELASELSELYETKVSVDLGRRKGKIVVEFATLEDLERIVNAMTPDGHPPV